MLRLTLRFLLTSPLQAFYSQLNFRLWIHALRFREEAPYLGVQETGEQAVPSLAQGSSAPDRSPISTARFGVL